VPVEVLDEKVDEPPGLSGHRVLLVDSCESSRAAVAAELTRWGMRVDEAGSAEGALAGDVSAEIGILDQKVLERIEVIQEIRRKAEGIRLVVLSPMGRRTPIASAADVVLTKPARSRQLARTLGRLLSGEPLPARYAPAPPSSPTGRATHPVRILLV